MGLAWPEKASENRSRAAWVRFSTKKGERINKYFPHVVRRPFHYKKNNQAEKGVGTGSWWKREVGAGEFKKGDIHDGYKGGTKTGKGVVGFNP